MSEKQAAMESGDCQCPTPNPDCEHPTCPRVAETAQIREEAEWRYHTDAEFHAEVYQAVAVALSSYPKLNEIEKQFAREVALVAVSLALHRRHRGGPE